MLTLLILFFVLLIAGCGLVTYAVHIMPSDNAYDTTHRTASPQRIKSFKCFWYGLLVLVIAGIVCLVALFQTLTQLGGN